jgi:alpha-glucosidase
MRLRSAIRATVGLAWTAAAALAQSDLIKVPSPNGQIEFRLMVAQPREAYALPRIAYQVYFQGKRLIDTSFLGYEIEDPVPLLGENVGLTAAKTESVDETYAIPAGKTKTVRNRYNSALAEYLQNGSLGRRIDIEARAYDDGVAFRYIVPNTTPVPEIRVDNEDTEFNFEKDGQAYPLILQNFQTNYADEYSHLTLSSIHPESLVGAPFLVEQPGIAWVAITEANVDNYAGLYFSRVEGAKTGSGKTITTLAPRPDQPAMAVYSKTPLVSPWRVLMIASDPGRLIESNLTMNLNPPSAIADTSWIKPGKAIAIPTAGYKPWIDFAADSKLQYVSLGPEWAATKEGMPPDITAPAAGPNSKNGSRDDLKDLLSYARSRHVGVWLAADWHSLERQMDQAFPLFETWGVAGVVVEGVDRQDQEMSAFERRIVAQAAAHRLMLDFHGAYIPDGVSRTYPNVLTQQAVLGSEYRKSSARPNPRDDAILPFTRMLAGPMDYAPGGFRDATPAEFVAREQNPMTLGTRAHELALFVVFDVPFTILPDPPEVYRGEKDFDFVREIPSTWDETRFLSGQIGEFAVVARRSGREWYIGAITNWTPREIAIPLGFLGVGGYVAEIYADAPGASNPNQTRVERRKSDASATLQLRLAPGGGAAIRLSPLE